jgi:ubiquinone/menaquinone biosynthesis C-methylase UbiE
VADLLVPPRDIVPKTGDDDPLDFYYRRFTKGLYRGRLRMAVDLLGDTRFASLLDVGYGSGIFLPELARHTDRLVGLEVHDEAPRIQELLRRLDLEAELVRGSLYALPFADDEFDALVCISVLEHLTDLDNALTELARVVRPGGAVVLGFPVRNPVTDAFFRLVGYNPRELHPSGHKQILAAARRSSALAVERETRMPRFLPTSFAGYAGCRARAV